MVDGSTVFRAFLINLDRWVSEGIEPPPSAFPRLVDGTAVTPETVLEQVGAVPGLALLDRDRLPRLNAAYPIYVPAVYADGNEVCGSRMPDLSVPVATHTGWAVRHPSTGGEGQFLDMMGSTLPFAATERERQERGDPRPSLESRYRDRDEYIARARAAASDLAAQRYILEEDVEIVAEDATRRYDLFAPALTTR